MEIHQTFSLAFQANQFHQRLTDITYTYPIRWNAKKHLWIIETHSVSKLFSYHKLPYVYRFAYCFLLHMQCIYLARTKKSYPPFIFPFSVVEFFGFVVYLSVDAMCKSHGGELVIACNWSYVQGHLWLRHYRLIGKIFRKIIEMAFLLR